MTYSDADPEVRRVRQEVRHFKTSVLTYFAVIVLLSAVPSRN